MLAKQIRIRNIYFSDTLLKFKGFILKNLGAVLSPVYSVVGPVPLEGSLNSILLQSSPDYTAVPNITYQQSHFPNGAGEIVITFSAEVSFDEIRCVCGPAEKHHFSSLTLEYKSSAGNWSSYEYANNNFLFNENNVSLVTYIPSFNLLDDSLSCVLEKNTLKSVSSVFTINSMSLESFTTGKHFVEITIENASIFDSHASNNFIGIIESNSNPLALATTDVRSYFIGFNQSVTLLRKRVVDGVTNETYHYSYLNSLISKTTIALFVDLDNNRIKYMENGANSSPWITIVRSTPGQAFRFHTQIKNLNNNLRLTLNKTPLFQYTDLTPDYNTSIFDKMETMYFKKSFTLKENTENPYWYHPYTLLDKGLYYLPNVATDFVSEPDHTLPPQPNSMWQWNGLCSLEVATENPYWHNPHTLLDKGLYYLPNVATDFVSEPAFCYGSSHDEISNSGRGYIKNTVHIDYPPKEPIAKYVVLFSIRENKVVQKVRSDPLSGQYEFKRLVMNYPYLIYTYDEDENYNADIIGPVYPTLMPLYEGLVE